ncbi:MAG: sigma-70 family RNA polymerase sigma factor [Thermoleophilia bacterium]|nr:sigma-70 family RNA polymerase sigma factor [Thermoleophilia bacterium]
MGVPPFERFYESHRDEIWAFLVRRLGPERAEDAFQETFLRALRAYPSLEHGRHLRAWAYTIAGRIAIDETRRKAPVLSGSEPLSTLGRQDGRPAYAEIEHLAAALPPRERAAVVLRYAYDLDYEDIGDALGSSAEAARQAASSGVRRLRRRGVGSTETPSSGDAGSAGAGTGKELA